MGIVRMLVKIYYKATLKWRLKCILSVKDIIKKSVFKTNKKFKRSRRKQYNRVTKKTFKNLNTLNELKREIIL